MNRFKKELLKRGLFTINESELFGDPTILKDKPSTLISYDCRAGMYSVYFDRHFMPHYSSSKRHTYKVRAQFEDRCVAEMILDDMICEREAVDYFVNAVVKIEAMYGNYVCELSVERMDIDNELHF